MTNAVRFRTNLRSRENLMPALNFQKRFAPLVESGEKRQTIRRERVDGRLPCKPGDRLVLYTGMRSKNCRRLAEVRCTAVETIRINRKAGKPIIWVRYENMDAEAQARADGFESADSMADWFQETHGLPFRGLLIRWRPLGSGFDTQEHADGT